MLAFPFYFARWQANRVSRRIAANRRYILTTASGEPVSRLGIGTARMQLGFKENEEAMKAALSRGLNLIDTSSSYGLGQSEKLIQKVLKESSLALKHGRESVYIVTKYGYLPPSPEGTQGSPEPPEIVEVAEGVRHCIHPAFQEQQLTNSLERLDCGFIDLYLIQNPDHFYESVAMKSSPEELQNPLAMLRHNDELLRRIGDAFVALESEVKQGRIKAYGISCNSVSAGPNAPYRMPYVGLTELAKAAAMRVGNDRHNFRAIELPGNILEPHGLDGCAGWAKENGVHILVNRPLNAITEDGTWRLADDEIENSASEIERRYSKGLQDILEHFTPQISGTPTEEEAETIEACEWLRTLILDLDRDRTKFTSVMHYEDNLAQGIVPLLMQKLEGMDDTSADMLQSFFEAYGKMIKLSCAMATRRKVESALGETISRATPLQQYAVQWLLNHPVQVDCVLVGLTKPQYVDELAPLLNK